MTDYAAYDCPLSAWARNEYVMIRSRLMGSAGIELPSGVPIAIRLSSAPSTLIPDRALALAHRSPCLVILNGWRLRPIWPTR